MAACHVGTSLSSRPSGWSAARTLPLCAPGNCFSKVLYTVALYMKYTRVLTFQNVCVEQRLPPGEFVPIPRTILAQLLRRPRSSAVPPRRLAPPVSGTVAQKSSFILTFFFFTLSPPVFWHRCSKVLLYTDVVAQKSSFILTLFCKPFKTTDF